MVIDCVIELEDALLQFSPGPGGEQEEKGVRVDTGEPFVFVQEPGEDVIDGLQYPVPDLTSINGVDGMKSFDIDIEERAGEGPLLEMLFKQLLKMQLRRPVCEPVDQK